MILYLDTSAIVKLYVEEEGSSAVRSAVQSAGVVATSRVAYAETHAALAAACRLERISVAERAAAAASFRLDWRAYLVVNVTQALVELAGDLVLAHELRGFDAIHVASALLLSQRSRQAMRFLTWDRRMSGAASALGLAVEP
ncbi:MAG: type II toxin-antitoxin system VapC family toxin [Clostridia bacterium]|nr:type II toxin-antitoxin system VapC family toxin [Clostridia bacterium]